MWRPGNTNKLFGLAGRAISFVGPSPRPLALHFTYFVIPPPLPLSQNIHLKITATEFA